MEEATRDLIAKAVTLVVEDLKRQNPEVLIGEKLITYDKEGNVVKEEVRIPSGARSSEAAKPAETQSLAGLRRATVNFSTCKITPRGVIVISGGGECIEYGGKNGFPLQKEILNLKRTYQILTHPKTGPWMQKHSFPKTPTVIGRRLIYT